MKTAFKFILPLAWAGLETQMKTRRETRLRSGELVAFPLRNLGRWAGFLLKSLPQTGRAETPAPVLNITSSPPVTCSPCFLACHPHDTVSGTGDSTAAVATPFRLARGPLRLWATCPLVSGTPVCPVVGRVAGVVAGLRLVVDSPELSELSGIRPRRAVKTPLHAWDCGAQMG